MQSHRIIVRPENNNNKLMLYALAGITAGFLFIYLLIALLKPELFP